MSLRRDSLALGPTDESATPSWRCIDCASALGLGGACSRCGRAFPIADGIREAINPLEGRNRVAARFYDGEGWTRFRVWERLFLTLQGGQAYARRQILRHLGAGDGGRLLEVGIGDGENLGLLPRRWTIYGVDIARTQLVACRNRRPEMAQRLAWAEAECLPFEDASFDACYSIGGFNYVSDHAAVLGEMRRVTRPGGTLLVADEVPGLQRAGIGHLIGIRSIDVWWLGLLGVDAEFARMVFDLDIDLDGLIREAWPGSVRHRIWNRLGYCQVGTA